MLKKIVRILKEPKYVFQYLVHNGNFKNMSDEKYLKMMFRYRVGYELNLDNPKTFNKKLQWFSVVKII